MRSDPRKSRRRSGAFSLLELMIAVGLLTLIVAALYAMFDQTQKAFRQSLNQADLSEGGRSAQLHASSRSICGGSSRSSSSAGS